MLNFLIIYLIGFSISLALSAWTEIVVKKSKSKAINLFYLGEIGFILLVLAWPMLIALDSYALFKHYTQK